MSFEWQGINDLMSFANFTNLPQDGVKKGFVIDIDPSKVEEEGLFEFTLVASDGAIEEEFHYSIEFYM